MGSMGHCLRSDSAQRALRAACSTIQVEVTRVEPVEPASFDARSMGGSSGAGPRRPAPTFAATAGDRDFGRG